MLQYFGDILSLLADSCYVPVTLVTNGASVVSGLYNLHTRPCDKCCGSDRRFSIIEEKQSGVCVCARGTGMLLTVLTS